MQISKLMSKLAPSHVSDHVHHELRVTGIVQGVGFRPFVYRLARNFGLTGAVWNDGRGVVIHAQGAPPQLAAFAKSLHAECPTAAVIEEITTIERAGERFTSFVIADSDAGGTLGTRISPDIAVCPDCRSELLDATDRRHRHVFINCTNCGPRFTIIRDLPYDRASTTMSRFDLCPHCVAEYADPLDRRFHAQPVACPECGPRLRFSLARCPELVYKDDQDAISQSVGVLRQGGVLLIQGIGGFHLACDAACESAVNELRRRKRRDARPFAVMFPNLGSLESWCAIDEVGRRELASPRAPIVICDRHPNCSAASSISPGTNTIGAFLPYAPLHLLLLNDFGEPIVLTSANCTGEPIIHRTDDAHRQLPMLADAMLWHNREIAMFCDDSVVRVIANAPQLLRRSRGYVPVPIKVSFAIPSPVIAFGADIKNALGIGRKHDVILSQHIGDMDNSAVVQSAEHALSHLLRLTGTTPEIIVHDLHPDYGSTRLALEWSHNLGVRTLSAQHHHAHLASCLAENGITRPALGIILDGTGLGTDNTIWGGELLYGGYQSFQRLGHITPVPLLGNDLAARDPWRMALAWMQQSGMNDDKLRSSLYVEVRARFGEECIGVLLNASDSGAYTTTSSMGRLLDAIAALTGFGARTQYEGQAAMWLESVISSAPEKGYTCAVSESDNTLHLNPTGLFQQLLHDINAGVTPAVISHRAHEGLAQAWSTMATHAAESMSCTTIALSGGCFQNKFLSERISELLTQRGLTVFTHRAVPANDGGIALGQIAIAAHQVT